MNGYSSAPEEVTKRRRTRSGDGGQPSLVRSSGASGSAMRSCGGGACCAVRVNPNRSTVLAPSYYPAPNPTTDRALQAVGWAALWSVA
jgi:hypothetical protein